MAGDLVAVHAVVVQVKCGLFGGRETFHAAIGAVGPATPADIPGDFRETFERK